MISVPGPGDRYFLALDPAPGCQPVQIVRDSRTVQARLLHDRNGPLRFRGERLEDGLLMLDVKAAGHGTSNNLLAYFPRPIMISDEESTYFFTSLLNPLSYNFHMQEIIEHLIVWINHISLPACEAVFKFVDVLDAQHLSFLTQFNDITIEPGDLFFGFPQSDGDGLEIVRMILFEAHAQCAIDRIGDAAIWSFDSIEKRTIDPGMDVDLSSGLNSPGSSAWFWRLLIIHPSPALQKYIIRKWRTDTAGPGPSFS